MIEDSKVVFENFLALKNELARQSFDPSRPAYRKVIALGKPVVKYLLLEEAAGNHFWDEAIRKITGHQIDRKEYDWSSDTRGTLAECWVGWGFDNGYLKRPDDEALGDVVGADQGKARKSRIEPRGTW
jgi:hypothetical protein